MDVYEEADLYCAAFSWPLDQEVDFLVGLAPRARNVLEPFCGNARYGPLFVERGLSYHGLDLSAAMLARGPKVPGIHLHEGDAADFRIPGTRFDLAFCAVNSIRHLTDPRAIVGHLSCVRRHLAPEGIYVVELELVNHDGPWTWKPEHGGEWSMPLPDGTEVEARWRREACDLARRTCRERATFRHVDPRIGRTIEDTTHLYEMRMWTFADLMLFVREAGLRIRETWLNDGDTHRPPTVATPAAENDGQNRYYVLTHA